MLIGIANIYKQISKKESHFPIKVAYRRTDRYEHLQNNVATNNVSSKEPY